MHFFSVFTLMTLLHVLVIIGVSFRVIHVRLPVAVSLAWLLLVFFLPLVGAIAYLVLGEKRLGRKFMARSRTIKGRYDNWLKNLPPENRSDPQGLSPEARTLNRLAQTTVNIPATIRGWCTTPVAPTSMICWPPESKFSDLKADCCTPKALWLIGKSRCSARSISMCAASGWILR
jgi:cardiolipin synthase